MALIVDALPADRPLCEHCGKKLSYFADDLEAKQVETGEHYYDGSAKTRRVVTRKRFIRWRGYPRGAVRPFFCTLSCALAFATNVIRQRNVAARIAADRRAAGG
jgi:hypothetical protein